MAEDVRIEVVTDLDAAWADLTRLMEAIVLHHEPWSGERLQPGWEPLWREQISQPGMHILTARTEDGHAVGMAIAEARDDRILGVSTGMLAIAYVEPEWRHHGVGRRFVEAVEAWCRERGLSRLDLSVRAANVDGIAAWRAMGFVDESYRLKRTIES